MLTPNRRFVRTCALTLVAGVCLGALAGPAEAAFPGRDGRVIWVEKEFSHRDDSDLFYVLQRQAPGEPAERRGGMFCLNAPEAGRELCPFFRPSLSPDGATIVLGVTRPLTDSYAAPRRASLATADPNDGFPGYARALPDMTDFDREPAWAPDGERLVFVGRVDGLSDLFVVDLDGTNLRRLTTGPDVESEPVWSIGGQIAFERGRGIWSIGTDGGGLRRLTAKGRHPDWSPDGRRLVFDRNRHLYTTTRTGRRPTRLAGSGIYPAWAPSGRKIAFRRNYDIYTANPDGTSRKRIYNWGPQTGSTPARRYAPRDIDWGPRQR